MHIPPLLLLCLPAILAGATDDQQTPRELYDAAAAALAEQQEQFLAAHGASLHRRGSLDFLGKSHLQRRTGGHGGKVKVRRPKERYEDGKLIRRVCTPASFPSASTTASLAGTISSASHTPTSEAPAMSEYHTTSAASHSLSESSASSTTESPLPSPSSSSEAAPSPSQGSNGANTGDAIFPVSVRNSWNTVNGRDGSLSFDDALKPLTAGKLPPGASAPDGSWALQASYPANTVKYSAATGHGYSFYTEGLKNGVDVTSATEVIFTYSVYFSEGFDFVKGGKLPGLYGGENLDVAKSCSGGRQDSRDQCFSARMMWRANGAGEFYNYFPTAGHQPSGYCSIPPMSVCDANYGDSIGRGSFYFPTGQWTTVAQRLRLNSPASESNGEQELYVNGHSVLKVSGLQMRVTDSTKIYGIMAQTFFGGSDQTWASPKDQWAWFKDWSLGVVY